MDDRRPTEPAPIDPNRSGTDPAAALDATIPVERTPDVQESEAHPS
ncbi:hypothetical protein K7957_04395 [Sphingomonas yunnanensis]|nr:hypothetical protein [Sphingomonas yunnanensis]MBY9062166.1 hypothetical protein [Sphingomonas yunnanensis]